MQRIQFIDGLRGILALIVFFHHFILMFFPTYYYGCATHAIDQSLALDNYKLIAYSPLNLLINGNFAVMFFFVLSGYVLSLKHLKHYSPQLLAADIFKRYFRLVIPILASCLLVYFSHRLRILNSQFVVRSEMNETWLMGLFRSDPSFWKVLTISLIDSVFFGKVPYNSVLWTMVYEFFGAIIVYIILFMNQFNKRPLAVISFFSIIALATSSIYLLPFCLGLAIAYLPKIDKIFKGIRLKQFFMLLLFSVGLYLASYPSAPTPIIAKYMHKWIIINGFSSMAFYEALGCSFLLFGIINSKLLAKILSYKPFMFLGKISFSLYLTHLLILATFSSWIFKKYYLTHSFNASAQVVFACSLPAVIIVAYGFYKLVEEPTPKIAKFIAAKWFKFQT